MKFDDLKFVRLTEPSQFFLIPRMLFEQVKDADFKIDRLYQFGPLLLASPLTFLYVLAEKEQLKNGHAPVKGVLWLTINPFEEMFYVEMLSVDKEYQESNAIKNGNIPIKETLEFIRSIPEYENLDDKIIMITRCPFAFERVGWKQSKKVRMEI